MKKLYEKPYLSYQKVNFLLMKKAGWRQSQSLLHIIYFRQSRRTPDIHCKVLRVTRSVPPDTAPRPLLPDRGPYSEPYKILPSGNVPDAKAHTSPVKMLKMS